MFMGYIERRVLLVLFLACMIMGSLYKIDVMIVFIQTFYRCNFLKCRKIGEITVIEISARRALGCLGWLDRASADGISFLLF